MSTVITTVPLSLVDGTCIPAGQSLLVVEEFRVNRESDLRIRVRHPDNGRMFHVSPHQVTLHKETEDAGTC